MAFLPTLSSFEAALAHENPKVSISVHLDFSSQYAGNKHWFFVSNACESNCTSVTQIPKMSLVDGTLTDFQFFQYGVGALKPSSTTLHPLQPKFISVCSVVMALSLKYALEFVLRISTAVTGIPVVVSPKLTSANYCSNCICAPNWQLGRDEASKRQLQPLQPL